MEILDLSPLHDEPADYPALHIGADGEVDPTYCSLQVESLLDVFVNDVLVMHLTCSAGSLAELALGRLYTEGIIGSADEVDALSVCESSMRAYVYLKDRAARPKLRDAEEVPTCCTGNRILRDFVGANRELRGVEPIAWKASAVLSLAREFGKDKTAHARTKGAHSAYLATLDGEVLTVGEDIGRHNAFDKVVGWALIHGVDLSRCMLFTSGRVPTDMVTKAIRSRIPVLISKAVATDKTVRIARQYGLTLLCSATAKGFDVIADSKLMRKEIRQAV